ncbi:uncharacterized protein AMSG_01162 [Thecamonas trahens ATCC 50062]|uniref:Nucleolar pre-ribosomal-associated protein 1 C-terminal domain-containing protein n=1 Tax=Thecamonas trahens ATCC 50062 TaxID=461836 RepID=A0A0L0DMA2_THETB|nr:hypothetical protein AMSG_01162 [Thecamonas trahens ATCC 50062]KNC53449.1 hypothetical protein AMSG_01162 [Thecamonas trahens ATCC 50062]|eukprot:XP_013761773.1 hypothetical protein AMSG_01162 [Thecamonas trahens ATCC 50062]
MENTYEDIDIGALLAGLGKEHLNDVYLAINAFHKKNTEALAERSGQSSLMWAYAAASPEGKELVDILKRVLTAVARSESASLAPLLAAVVEVFADIIWAGSSLHERTLPRTNDLPELQEQADDRLPSLALALARAILRSYLARLYPTLSSSGPQALATLRLLAAIAALSPTIARELIRRFDWSLKSFLNIPFDFGRASQKNGVAALSKANSLGVSPSDLVSAYFEILITLLAHDAPGIAIATVSLRTVVPATFQILGIAPPSAVVPLLTLITQRIALASHVTKRIRMKLFNSQTLVQLSKNLGILRNDEDSRALVLMALFKVLLNADDPAMAMSASDLLRGVITAHRTSDVYRFFSPSSAVGDAAGRALASVSSSALAALETLPRSTSIRFSILQPPPADVLFLTLHAANIARSTTVFQLLVSLHTTWGLRQRMLIQYVLSSLPALVTPYIAACNFSFEPRPSLVWFSNMSWLTHLLRTVTPPLIVDAPLESQVMPLTTTVSALSRALQHASPLVRFTAFGLLDALFARVAVLSFQVELYFDAISDNPSHPALVLHHGRALTAKDVALDDDVPLAASHDTTTPVATLPSHAAALSLVDRVLISSLPSLRVVRSAYASTLRSLTKAAKSGSGSLDLAAASLLTSILKVFAGYVAHAPSSLQGERMLFTRLVPPTEVLLLLPSATIDALVASEYFDGNPIELHLWLHLLPVLGSANFTAVLDRVRASPFEHFDAVADAMAAAPKPDADMASFLAHMRASASASDLTAAPSSNALVWSPLVAAYIAHDSPDPAVLAALAALELTPGVLASLCASSNIGLPSPALELDTASIGADQARIILAVAALNRLMSTKRPTSDLITAVHDIVDDAIAAKHSAALVELSIVVLRHPALERAFLPPNAITSPDALSLDDGILATSVASVAGTILRALPSPPPAVAAALAPIMARAQQAFMASSPAPDSPLGQTLGVCLALLAKGFSRELIPPLVNMLLSPDVVEHIVNAQSSRHSNYHIVLCLLLRRELDVNKSNRGDLLGVADTAYFAKHYSSTHVATLLTVLAHSGVRDWDAVSRRVASGELDIDDDEVAFYLQLTDEEKIVLRHTSVLAQFTTALVQSLALHASLSLASESDTLLAALARLGDRATGEALATVVALVPSFCAALANWWASRVAADNMPLLAWFALLLPILAPALASPHVHLPASARDAFAVATVELILDPELPSPGIALDIITEAIEAKRLPAAAVAILADIITSDDHDDLVLTTMAPHSLATLRLFAESELATRDVTIAFVTWACADLAHAFRKPAVDLPMQHAEIDVCLQLALVIRKSSAFGAYRARKPVVAPTPLVGLPGELLAQLVRRALKRRFLRPDVLFVLRWLVPLIPHTEDAPDLTTIYDMIFQHSQLRAALYPRATDADEQDAADEHALLDFAHTDEVKQALVVLMHALLTAPTAPATAALARHQLPLLLAAYGATTSLADRVLLHILFIYESAQLSLFADAWGWGEHTLTRLDDIIEIELRRSLGGTVSSLEASDNAGLLSSHLIDMSMLDRSLRLFPIDMPLSVNATSEIPELEGTVWQSLASKILRGRFSAAGNTAHVSPTVVALANASKGVTMSEPTSRPCYDMGFLLTFFVHVAAANTEASVVIESGALAIGFRALAAHHSNVRKLGYELVSLIESLIRAYRFRSRSNFEVIVDLVKGSVTQEFERLPSALSLALALAARVLSFSNNPVFPVVVKWLTKYPSIYIHRLPFRGHFAPTKTGDGVIARPFVFDIIAHGAHSARDLANFDKASIVQGVFAAYLDSGNPSQVVDSALAFVRHMARVPALATRLVSKYSFAEWMAAAIAPSDLSGDALAGFMTIVTDLSLALDDAKESAIVDTAVFTLRSLATAVLTRMIAGFNARSWKNYEISAIFHAALDLGDRIDALPCSILADMLNAYHAHVRPILYARVARRAEARLVTRMVNAPPASSAASADARLAFATSAVAAALLPTTVKWYRDEHLRDEVWDHLLPALAGFRAVPSASLVTGILALLAASHTCISPARYARLVVAAARLVGQHSLVLDTIPAALRALDSADSGSSGAVLGLVDALSELVHATAAPS